jgi:anti-sigma factor RsiW
MRCDEFEDLALEALDGALSAEAREPLDRHAALCARCRQFLETQRKMDQALEASLAAPALSDAFERRLRARLAREQSRWRWLDAANRIGTASVALAGVCWGLANLSALPPETLVAAMFAVTFSAGSWMLLPERLRSALNPFRA